MDHNLALDSYIFVFSVFNGFTAQFGIISFARKYNKLPENILAVCKYILTKGKFLKLSILVVNFICIFGYLHTLFNTNMRIVNVLLNSASGLSLLTFGYSFSINFSYRFFVNNKNFNLVASDSDRRIYRINNVILAISVAIIVYFKYF